MGSVQPCYVGIDLAFAKNKHLPIVVCSWENGRLVPQPLRRFAFAPPRGKGNAATLKQESICCFAREARIYIESVCNQLALHPLRIGIDAPSEPRNSKIRRRLAETELDRVGISCFATPSTSEFDVILDKVRKHLAAGGEESRIPHANQLWMLVGFAMFEELSHLAPCLEVFPQATARVLGASQLHKSRPGAVEAQLSAVARYTGWPVHEEDVYSLREIAWGDRHDQLDAYLSAWVASLEESERMAYGVPPNDAIWVPKLGPEKPSIIPVDTPATPKLSIGLDLQHLCPGCGKKEFKQWPLGWDSHAAHKCEGLKETDQEKRKLEFRSKYLYKVP
ncbi:MAG: hypothetical protein BVN35_13915 [Proteobacteria bacterium ST_bin11]|nr:MAG: hypothetical protein BVN35_13915 [Proteobacteria bacterium ST_bin11]